MSPEGGTRSSRNPVFTAIATQRRRDLLQLLLEYDTPMTLGDVTANFTGTDRHAIQTGLIHTDLPLLEDVGLITWTRDTSTIALASHPALEDPRFQLLLNAEADGLSETLSHLAFERRRVLLTMLRDAPTSMTRTDLARELLRSEKTNLEPDPDTVDAVTASLHHVELPALDEVGLLQYDHEAGRAASTDHPGLDEVFTIVHEPENRLVDAYNSFFEGLGSTYDDLSSETGTEAEWPHFWGDSSHG